MFAHTQAEYGKSGLSGGGKPVSARYTRPKHKTVHNGIAQSEIGPDSLATPYTKASWDSSFTIARNSSRKLTGVVSTDAAPRRWACSMMASAFRVAITVT